MFSKFFFTFVEGIEALVAVSYSAGQALSPLPKTEHGAVQVLAWNALNNRADERGKSALKVNAAGVSYTTSGGFSFGWSLRDRRNVEEYGGTFWIKHPAEIPRGSSLRKSALRYGWIEGDPAVAAAEE